MAGTIELLGDNPWGWRVGSVFFGLIAIVAMYALVRAARGSPWLAVGAAAVMALDNLMLVHARIATLDIYMIAMVLVAATFYMRGWVVASGIALGIAGCMKLVGLGVIPAFVLLEALRVVWARRDGEARATLRKRGTALLVMLVSTFATLCLVVWALDVAIPAYDPGTHITYAGSPFTHISHMLSYAAQLKSLPNATGISSTPWQWL
jgi:predicted membrane-bound dolichyl-phosphate-mannose-protein mannosyltransferase